jgi:N-acetylmuramoyl-L-alanine amidase
LLVRAAALLMLFLLPVPAKAAGYIVQPGDTLTTIAQQYHVSVGALARTNGIQNANLVPIGRVLSIPTPMHRFYYRVRWGDTLTGIALNNGLTISTIHALNPSLGAYPLAGQLLRLCSPCGGTAPVTSASTAPATVAASGSTYTVQPGDTLSGIAATYGTTPTALASTNNLVNPDLVVIGVHLTVPGAAAVPTAASPSIVSSGYNPAATRQLITSYAYTYGVPPALALAISWQESGFNQNMVSYTGAIGAMQVEPYTGDHIAWLLGRSFNLYNVDDNVHAGVYWISTLLRYYGGDERSAVAAYYQGTRSIAQRGWFEDTKQYVANVMSLEASFAG